MKKRRLSCQRCQAPLPGGDGRGRPQLFCSDACQKASKREGQQGQCDYCGGPVDGEDRFCSDRCFYHGHKGIVPSEKRDLHAYNEELIPVIPRGQIAAHEQKRPDWQAWVYGGAERPKPRRRRDQEGGET